MDWLQRIKTLQEGYQEVRFGGKKYGLSKQVFNQGKSIKLYAEELGGTDFISCNWYQTQSQEYLKPCEMPKAKVINFLEGMILTDFKKDLKNL